MASLRHLRVIEMAGIGPAPFCGMLLADMGAEVLRIDRVVPVQLGVEVPARLDVLHRNKRAVALDLKCAAGLAAARTLIERADVLIEGFRPGVMERLGLGPQDCESLNPRLVYGRMTGWGHDGPLAKAAGHDLNYIALAGALHGIGARGGAPAIPWNLVGDFGGGALYLAMGVLAAVIEAGQSGRGQVVEAAMVDGIASLMNMQQGIDQSGLWPQGRGASLLNGGAPYYNVYETLDGKHVSIAAIETRFYDELLERIGAAPATDAQRAPPNWEDLHQRFAALFRTRTRAQWCALLEGTDACFAPVLDLAESAAHPHMAARGTYVEVEGVRQGAPAPRFSRTPSSLRRAPPEPGAAPDAALADWGVSAQQLEAWRAGGALG